MTGRGIAKAGLLVAGGVALFLWGVAVGAFRLAPFDTLWSVGNRLDRSVEGPFVNPHAVREGRNDAWLGTDADIVMLGDSITNGGRWNEMLPGRIVANRGVNGDTVGGLRQRLPLVLQAKPETIVLMIGINDIMAGNDVAYITREYEAIVRAMAPETRLILMSTLPCGAPVCDPRKRNAVETLNTSIAALAARMDVERVDINPVLAPQGLLDPTVTDDGIHLNGKGYRLWQSHLLPVLGPAGKMVRSP